MIVFLCVRDQWLGLTLFRDESSNASYWQMLNCFHQSSKQKEEIERESAWLALGSLIETSCLVLAYSDCYRSTLFTRCISD